MSATCVSDRGVSAMKIQASMRSIILFGAAALAVPTTANAEPAALGPLAARVPASPLLRSNEAQREQWRWAFATAQLKAVAAEALGTTVAAMPPHPPPPFN